MLLLHISDIHFRAPDCLNPDLDPDRPYRTRMIQDARTQVADLGSVGALLVSGDIAFKGDPAEYRVAFDWIEEFADACACPLEKIFVVPGNHDVDRNIIMGVPAVGKAQRAIVQVAKERRERELRSQFCDIQTGQALLKPLAAYNDFAKKFSCQVYPPEHLYWKQDLPLEGGVKLRMYGLTSTLLSGVDGKDDTRESLYLSPLQTVFDPIDDVVNLVMCHHPPDWFMDQDDVNDAVCGRAVIHLFGHKHRQRITREASYIRFSAGAVNPDRYEPGWQPGYNLIDVHVVGDGNNRAIEIAAHLRQWQTNPDLFRPMLTQQHEPVFYHRIPIPGHVAPVAANAREAAVEVTPAAEPDAAEEVVADVEATMSDEITRNLVFRFWNLTASQRREIALRLDLIDEHELRLPEPERYGRALLRAGERGLLENVAKEIAQREKQ